ncbi:ester cyclase [Francisella sp. 19X1-34]|uniref:nuclear transport factor 2 family protein n=1 Tax=Francisella sp. 19X1-34 TaxID=3087177 RepID=UPI002E342652|nr:ester cyclase [Francisella sp. 19X1-34]MED7789590.1 ester cyclase [Francisella sp. 19X1-34]
MNNSVFENKKLVRKFYEEMFCHRRVKESSLMLSENYIQNNNTFIPPGRDGFVKFFNKFVKKFKASGCDIINVCGEDDIVYLYATHWVLFLKMKLKWKVIDIYRVKDGELVEHWDSIEPTTTLSRIIYLFKACLGF